MQRVCGTDGGALWTTVEGAKKLQEKGTQWKIEQEITELKKEIESLKAKLGGDAKAAWVDEGSVQIEIDDLRDQLKKANAAKKEVEERLAGSLLSSDAQREIDALQERIQELEIDNKKMRSREVAGASFASSSENFSDSQGGSMAKKLMIKSDWLMKKSKYWKRWEERKVALDVAGILTWDGGGSHRNFVTLTFMSHVEVVEKAEGHTRWDFVVVADGKKIEFAASDEGKRSEWVRIIRDFCK